MVIWLLYSDNCDQGCELANIKKKNYYKTNKKFSKEKTTHNFSGENKKEINLHQQPTSAYASMQISFYFLLSSIA